MHMDREVEIELQVLAEVIIGEINASDHQPQSIDVSHEPLNRRRLIEAYLYFTLRSYYYPAEVSVQLSEHGQLCAQVTKAEPGALMTRLALLTRAS